MILLDTATDITVIPARVAEELHLIPLDEMPIGGSSGNRIIRGIGSSTRETIENHAKAAWSWRSGGMVAFGRPKGDRGSYRQWAEDGIAPDTQRLEGWLRNGDELQEIEPMDGWTSPRLGVRFDLSGDELQILRPDGRPLITYVELATEAEQAYQRADYQHQQAELERQRAEQERQRVQRLIAQLRAAGVDPDLS